MSPYALLLSLVFLTVSGAARATPQAGDALRLDGETSEIRETPLEPYLSTHRDALPGHRLASSDNWRGYVAQFAVIDGHLVLEHVYVRLHVPGTPPPADRVFTDVMPAMFAEQRPVVARWYSGTLVVPRGPDTGTPYVSVHARYVVLGIDAGRVVSRIERTWAELQAAGRTGSPH